MTETISKRCKGNCINCNERCDYYIKDYCDENAVYSKATNCYSEITGSAENNEVGRVHNR